MTEMTYLYGEHKCNKYDHAHTNVGVHARRTNIKLSAQVVRYMNGEYSERKSDCVV